MPKHLEHGHSYANRYGDDREEDRRVIDMPRLFVTSQFVKAAYLRENLLESFGQPVLTVEGPKHLVRHTMGAEMLPPQPMPEEDKLPLNHLHGLIGVNVGNAG